MMKKLLIALLATFALSFNTFAAVNLNTATQAELESLDGIGPVKAAAIIDYRKKNGGFKSVDELEKVDGVGDVTLQNVRKDVSVSGATKVPASSTKPAVDKPAKDATMDKPAKADKVAKDKPAKETKTKAVGNESAAASGSTADSKEVKADKPAKVKKEAKADKPAKPADTAKAEKKPDAAAKKAEKKAAADAKKAEKKAAADKKAADKKAATDAKKAADKEAKSAAKSN